MRISDINFCDLGYNFIYLLGCIPYTQLPYDIYNYRIISTGTHAVIYSKQNRNDTLKKKQLKIKDWDVYNNQILNRFTYYVPLCYQLFPETENSKLWGKDINKSMHLLSKSMYNILKLLDLDINVEPGTSILYFLSKLITLIILFIFLLNICNQITCKDYLSIIIFICTIILSQPIVLYI